MPRTAPPDPAIASALRRLDQLAESAPDLAEPLAFYRAALPHLHQAQTRIEPFHLDPAVAQRKLETGQPLLVGEDLSLDMEATRALFLSLCRLIESDNFSDRKRGWPFGPSSRGTLRAAAAQQLRRAVERDELDLSDVLAALALGTWRRAELIALDLKLDVDLLRLLAENSLRPALRAWAQALAEIDLDHWRLGHCPLCGSAPLLSEIRGKEGERRLRCGLCGASWYYPRLKCAFCGNNNHRQLGFLTLEGEEEKYSLQTCEACRRYLKVIVTYDPIPTEVLLAEDLATLHLDLIAEEREFSRAEAGRS